MDVKKLQELIECVSNSNLTYFEVEEGGTKIVMKKECEGVVLREVPKIERPISVDKVEEKSYEKVENVKIQEIRDEIIVKSPMVGTFYSAPSPDTSPFVAVGQRVKKGDILCIIEAMKIMNEIEAEVDGTIAAVCVQNGEMVEYGQALFRIQRDGE
ncbi:acetyl-CoA carboxylase biotin carboxyl carrier protein [Caloramator proteoclasticus]|uniref:Biotin carboxyl carrier protein of acetyl-CoA carboxylase n=1 Tax=Caloramator proteoclasticus DSM 10124 TaxID=1121262 RepID=A0A1M5AYV6_9CLOT|nr:acetyl-CoA carboxylase biotin carboxyl carrier protein [Caloramator proteoclasticus]SHF35383.1 acetyl-CoA carboxylase biotin carboxyl carrier protein [Caloramator proteoclasticus DSM 10124]